MLELTNLRQLHKTMRKNNDTKAVFNIIIKNKEFACLFLTNTKPYYFYLATVGVNIKSFEFPILSGYKIDTYIQRTVYLELCKYLEIKYDPFHFFSTNDLFKLINTGIPTTHYKTPSSTRLFKFISKHRNIEEPDKTYFLGFKNLPKWQSVSSDNYEKTKFAFGENTANRLKEQRISTCWTNDKNKENIILFQKFY